VVTNDHQRGEGQLQLQPGIRVFLLQFQLLHHQYVLFQDNLPGHDERPVIEIHPVVFCLYQRPH